MTENDILPFLKKTFRLPIDFVFQAIPDAHARMVNNVTDGKIQFDQQTLLSQRFVGSPFGYKDEEAGVYYLSTLTFAFIVGFCLFIELMFLVTVIATVAAFL